MKDFECVDAIALLYLLNDSNLDPGLNERESHSSGNLHRGATGTRRVIRLHADREADDPQQRRLTECGRKQ
jgi:hypothetical protein